MQGTTGVVQTSVHDSSDDFVLQPYSVQCQLWKMFLANLVPLGKCSLSCAAQVAAWHQYGDVNDGRHDFGASDVCHHGSLERRPQSRLVCKVDKGHITTTIVGLTSGDRVLWIWIFFGETSVSTTSGSPVRVTMIWKLGRQWTRQELGWSCVLANLIPLCVQWRNLLTFTYFSRTLLPSASSGYTIGRLSLTQLLTSIIEIPISLYHLGTSSSHRFRGLPLGRRSPGCITSALLWGAVGAILLMCDHHLILFLLAVCCAGCMFTRRLISSFLILSILVFPAAFLRHLISVVVNICLSLLVRVQFSLW